MRALMRYSSGLEPANRLEADPQPVGVLHDDHDDAFAVGTSENVTGPSIHPRRTELVLRAATCTASTFVGHLPPKDVMEEPGECVAIKVPFVVHDQPRFVGPNRSVLMRLGWWPSATSEVATVSTKPVGPHT